MDIDRKSSNSIIKEQDVRVAKRRVFGYAELIFDLLYMSIALVIGIYLGVKQVTEGQRLASIAAFVLVGGDAFHLVPRIRSIWHGDSAPFQKALGFGKLITSITMTIFYLMLWYSLLPYSTISRSSWLTPLMFVLAALRIALCLPKQNEWFALEQPVNWGIYRNIPFFLMGLIVTIISFLEPQLLGIGIAVLLSFAFYLPVVLWVNKNRMIGMLMLPKCVAYLWVLYLLMRLVH